MMSRRIVLTMRILLTINIDIYIRLRMSKDTNKKSIHATVTPRLASFVNKLVDTGRFRSQSEAVRAALRLLEDKERLKDVKLEALKEKIQKAKDEVPGTAS